jgi:Plant transposon protein
MQHTTLSIPEDNNSQSVLDSSSIDTTDIDISIVDDDATNSSNSSITSESNDSSGVGKRKNLIQSVMDTGSVVSTVAQLIVNEAELVAAVPKWGGSSAGKSPNKERDFDGAYISVVKDYFSGIESIYNEVDFERRFRVTHSIFNTIYSTILHYGLFSQKKDALGKAGIHPLVRTVSCFRFLAYGDSFDRNDEYLRLSESSTAQSVKQFCHLIVQHFGPSHLNRSPTEKERDRILIHNKKRGFPGMLASWDCSHFKWDKCPIKLHGAFKSRYANNKTVVLECVVDCFLWIWFCNFGNAGSLNDINILDKSSIVASIWTGKFDVSCPPYNLNGTIRDYMYFLVDGIYPPWSIFINTVTNPTTIDEKRFSKQQEGCRKDVERVFAVLQNKFQILSRALRLHSIEDINSIVQCVVILHNMMVESRINKNINDVDEDMNNNNNNLNNNNNNNIVSIFPPNNFNIIDQHNQHFVATQLAARVATVADNLKKAELHMELKQNLIQHMTRNKDTISFYHK